MNHLRTLFPLGLLLSYSFFSTAQFSTKKKLTRHYRANEKEIVYILIERSLFKNEIILSRYTAARYEKKDGTYNMLIDIDAGIDRLKCQTNYTGETARNGFDSLKEEYIKFCKDRGFPYLPTKPPVIVKLKQGN